VNLGPFRLTAFDPGDGMTFTAYDRYFLGRPKVDTVRVKLFANSNTLFSNLMAGTVDLFFESTLGPDLGFQLASNWTDGNVYQAYVSHRMLAPQFRPTVQIETANLDVRVRAALYHALDREALSEGLQGGHREYAAWEILPPNDVLYPAVKDGLRQYAYDPDRAKAILREVGWTPGADGMLSNAADGRPFHNAISASDLTVRDMPAYAAYWRQIGIQVDEIATPAAQVRNAEYRASYPAWEVTAQSGGDGILGKLEGPAAGPETRWAGNRGGFDDPRAQRLVDAYRASLSERDQFQAMKAIGEYVTAELPFLVLYGTVDPIGVRKGVKALDDRDGGDSGGRPIGTYTRNAHLWDVVE
jgi:peptide/nickel transport system substrate-binding protein